MIELFQPLFGRDAELADQGDNILGATQGVERSSTTAPAHAPTAERRHGNIGFNLSNRMEI